MMSERTSWSPDDYEDLLTRYTDVRGAQTRGAGKIVELRGSDLFHWKLVSCAWIMSADGGKTIERIAP